MHLISFLQGNQLFCIFLRDEKTEVQRLSISNWQIWAQTLSQNDPRASIQAETFKDSEIPTDGFLDLLNIGHMAFGVQAPRSKFQLCHSQLCALTSLCFSVLSLNLGIRTGPKEWISPMHRPVVRTRPSQLIITPHRGGHRKHPEIPHVYWTRLNLVSTSLSCQYTASPYPSHLNFLKPVVLI